MNRDKINWLKRISRVKWTLMFKLNPIKVNLEGTNRKNTKINKKMKAIKAKVKTYIPCNDHHIFQMTIIQHQATLFKSMKQF